MISAVVLTHNDETIIHRCLEGVRWCDEVVIIDDNSTDGTVKVAKKLRAKVFIHTLNDDFASQRNFGLVKAKGEWVLFIDSDEIVSSQLATEIQESLKHLTGISNIKYQISDRIVGYYVKRKDYLFGRWLAHGETANIRLLRLAEKDAGKWTRPVHEVWDVDGVVGELDSPLLHYPHQNVAQFLEEINRYSTLYARHLHSRGVKEPVWQIVVKPSFKFFVNYIWRLGFLDGTAGMMVAIMMSFHSFLVRGKLWQLHDAKKNKNI